MYRPVEFEVSEPIRLIDIRIRADWRPPKLHPPLPHAHIALQFSPHIPVRKFTGAWQRHATPSGYTCLSCAAAMCSNLYQGFGCTHRSDATAQIALRCFKSISEHRIARCQSHRRQDHGLAGTQLDPLLDRLVAWMGDVDGVGARSKP
jgi:hypothetical protein